MSNQIIKAERKVRNFTILDNTCLHHMPLSARAKGIHCFVMSLPPDWGLNKKELYTHFAEGRDALDTAIKELRDAGYVRYERIHKADGKLAGSCMVFCEVPRDTAFQGPGNQGPGKPHLLSTDPTTTKKPTIPPTPFGRSRGGVAGVMTSSEDKKKLPQKRGTKKDDVLVRLAKDPEDAYGIVKGWSDCPWAVTTHMEAYQVYKALLGHPVKKSYSASELADVDRALGELAPETVLGLFILLRAVAADNYDEHGEAIKGRITTPFEDLHAFAMRAEWIRCDCAAYMKGLGLGADDLWPMAIHDQGLIHDIRGVPNPTILQ